VRKLWSEVPIWRCAAIVGLVAIPWFAAMIHIHGMSYATTFFGYHNVERFVQGVNHHGQPISYALLCTLVGYAPWTLACVFQLFRLRALRRRSTWIASSRRSRLTLFAGFWLVVAWTFFASSASKLPSYYLPIAPAVALLAAAYLTCHSSSIPPISSSKEEAGMRVVTLSGMTCLVSISTLLFLLVGIALWWFPTLSGILR